MTWTSPNGKWHIRLQPLFVQGSDTPKGIGTFSRNVFEAMIHDEQHRMPRYHARVSFHLWPEPGERHARFARNARVPNYVADQLAVMIEDYRKERA